MFTRYVNFIRGVATNPCSKIGVVLCTSSFITLVILELARIFGILTNTYMGLVTYLFFPALFFLGLVLVSIGWYKLRKKTGESYKELRERLFAADDVKGSFSCSKLFRTITLLSLVNVIFISVISMQMFAFMDQPEFCGTACHSVMHPEWTTYQQSPHARVKCVECHVGEGAGALIDSKLNGIWQMISVTFDLLERPIPTPVRQLRPARETCEKCHWPKKFYGSRLKTITGYRLDEKSTPFYTTLNMKIDTGKRDGKTGIHWHITKENEVRYTSVDDEREHMIWVEVRQPDGNYRRYINPELTYGNETGLQVHTLDCVDCHNRATHIYEDPQEAIDGRIHQALLDRSLPYLKQEALHAISNNYPDKEIAFTRIADHMHGFYQRHYPKLARQKIALIDSAVGILQDIYARNIFPQMNITWGAYTSHIGHHGEQGCFRCHNSRLVDNAGNTISNDCTLCHSILAYDQREPFRFLQPPDTLDRDYPMHNYLRREFLDSYSQ